MFVQIGQIFLGGDEIMFDLLRFFSFLSFFVTMKTIWPRCFFAMTFAAREFYFASPIVKPIGPWQWIMYVLN